MFVSQHLIEFVGFTDHWVAKLALTLELQCAVVKDVAVNWKSTPAVTTVKSIIVYN